ncbi:MAG: carboxylesterase family protein, partial [Luteibacter sp.]
LSRMLARATPTWRYAFTDPHAPFALSRKADLGAYHASEIVYLFQTRWALADPARFSPAQQALADRMQKDWATFARTGRLEGTPDGVPATLLYGPSRTPVDEGVPPVGCAFWDTVGL